MKHIDIQEVVPYEDEFAKGKPAMLKITFNVKASDWLGSKPANVRA